MPLLRKFYQRCVDFGLAPKVHLIGMKWGGFFSLRFASENPEKTACIYLDPLVCNVADQSMPSADKRFQTLSQAYHMTKAEMLTSPLNPINALNPISGAKLPVFGAVGQDDLTVSHENNIDIVEERFRALSGNIELCRRNLLGHHPHGFDDRTKLLEFRLSNVNK